MGITEAGNDPTLFLRGVPPYLLNVFLGIDALNEAATKGQSTGGRPRCRGIVLIGLAICIIIIVRKIPPVYIVNESILVIIYTIIGNLIGVGPNIID